jgi:hypothetical protein
MPVNFRPDFKNICLAVIVQIAGAKRGATINNNKRYF